MRKQWMVAVVIIAAFGMVSFWPGQVQAFPSGKKSSAEDAGQQEKQAVEVYNLGVEHQKKADTLLAHGDSVAAVKEFKSARKEYEKAARLNSKFPEAFSNLGYCRRNLGDFKGALEAYDQALALKPDFPEAMEYRGVAYVRLGRMEDAMAAYNKLKQIDTTEAAELWQAIKSATKDTGVRSQPRQK